MNQCPKKNRACQNHQLKKLLADKEKSVQHILEIQPRGWKSSVDQKLILSLARANRDDVKHACDRGFQAPLGKIAHTGIPRLKALDKLRV